MVIGEQNGSQWPTSITIDGTDQATSTRSLQKCQLRQKITSLILSTVVCQMEKITHLSENLRKLKKNEGNSDRRGKRSK